MKHIDTLIADIEHVVLTGDGWTDDISAQVGRHIELILLDRMGERLQTEPTLRMSNLGYPCNRKLWYEVNQPECGESLRTPTLTTFMYGDIIEAMAIGLAKAAGHKVEGEQTTLRLRGIKGHRDCIIDGVTTDIKSASTFSFKKFKDHQLLHDDPFGYIRQIKSYVCAGRNDPLVTHKNLAGFLVIDKAKGNMHYELFEFSDEELEEHEEFVERTKFIVEDKDTVPDRAFDPVPYGLSGNESLCTQCSYCRFKSHCYENNLRVFLYNKGGAQTPVFFPKIVKEPNVVEVFDFFKNAIIENEE